MSILIWGSPQFPLYLHTPSESPVSLSLSDTPAVHFAKVAEQRLVEVLTVEHGRGLTNTRINRSLVGDSLRYVGHEDMGNTLRVVQESPHGIRAIVTLEQVINGVYRGTTTIENIGEKPLHVQAVSTLALRGLTGLLGAAGDLDVWSARNEWDGENRWFSHPLDAQAGIPDINPAQHGQAARGSVHRTGISTWSTGDWLPMGALENRTSRRTLLWQVEHNGAWRWELNSQYDHSDWVSLSLSGPTDAHHAWLHQLEPDESFTTVPATFTVASSLDAAFGQFTEYRRATHLCADSPTPPDLIFNDYMNTLMGDPTTEKLLPLIDAAAEVGARYFCIDAGWYDDDAGDWWPSVGAWEAAESRFQPGGLTAVLEYIRQRGMKPGLWLEPEVIGVRSRVANELPDEAFMTRAGVRIREHDRYLLDLRSAVARKYLDGVFARIFGEYGAEYVKWDYNVTPGLGPDSAALSPGEALLDHERALLGWFADLRERYPHVVFEACSSGAQRQDPATTRMYDLQSTSDQQDYRLYATIAAAAPTIITPEQAGNWAYPHTSMTDEQIVFCLVNGLSGRMYLSGYLNRMTAHQREIIREATALYPQIMAHNAASVPFWPLGLPGWKDDVVCLGLRTGNEVMLYIWNRADSTTTIAVPITGRPTGKEQGADGTHKKDGSNRNSGVDTTVSTLFPAHVPTWGTHWDRDTGLLHLDMTGFGESARVLRVQLAE